LKPSEYTEVVTEVKISTRKMAKLPSTSICVREKRFKKASAMVSPMIPIINSR